MYPFLCRSMLCRAGRTKKYVSWINKIILVTVNPVPISVHYPLYTPNRYKWRISYFSSNNSLTNYVRDSQKFWYHMPKKRVISLICNDSKLKFGGPSLSPVKMSNLYTCTCIKDEKAKWLIKWGVIDENTVVFLIINRHKIQIRQCPQKGFTLLFVWTFMSLPNLVYFF